MKTSIGYLEEALTRMGDEPNSKKAERLKMSKQALHNYITGASRMDNFACIMVGRYLGIDPMKIMAACEEERAKSEEKQEFWRDFRKTLSGLAIAAALGVTTMAAPSQAHAYTAIKQNDIVFIMSNLRRKKRRFYLLSRLLQFRYTTRFAYA